jgi:bifunctional non-homologous end joining protein LigD
MPRAGVEITHPDRVLFPDRSTKNTITKRDPVDYYQAVADTMLRHLKSRPLSVQRFPRGIDQQNFVQQDSPMIRRTILGSRPAWRTGGHAAGVG